MAWGNKGNRSWSGSIGWVSVSYSTSWWKTTYKVWNKSYSDVKSAANAIKGSSWYDKSKWLVRWSGWWSTGGWWSTKTITGWFMQNWKLYNEYSDWTTGLASEWKWGSTWTSWGSNKTITWWYMQNWKLYNEYSDWSSGLASEWKWGNSWWWSSTISNNISSNSNINDKKKEDYTSASWENYTNAYNHYKEQWMNDADARNKASAFLESENLIKWKSDKEIAEETQKSDDIDPNEDPLYWLGDDLEETYEETEEPPMNEQTFTWKDVVDYANNLFNDWSSKNAESNVVKETVPEERDTTYDYNTYVAPNTTYTWWETQDIKQEGLTWADKYQEPVTNALQDLWLLTPNEQAAESMPGTEVQEWQPETFNSAEEIVNAFNDAATAWLEDWQIASNEDAVRLYQEYKRKLEKFVNDNKLSKEEAANFLNQMRNNEWIQNFLRNNSNQ